MFAFSRCHLSYSQFNVLHEVYELKLANKSLSYFFWVSWTSFSSDCLLILRLYFFPLGMVLHGYMLNCMNADNWEGETIFLEERKGRNNQ